MLINGWQGIKPKDDGGGARTQYQMLMGRGQDSIPNADGEEG